MWCMMLIRICGDDLVVDFVDVYACRGTGDEKEDGIQERLSYSGVIGVSRSSELNRSIHRIGGLLHAKAARRWAILRVVLELARDVA